MAVYAPTPPTPPTPPSPPRIVLGEGGSVRESTVPESHGPKSGDEINEEAARSAVAHGAGKLSKTTVTRPEDKKEQQQAATEKASAAEKSATTERSTPAPRQETTLMPRANSAPQTADPTVTETQRQMAATGNKAFAEQPIKFSDYDDGHETHGPVYWVFSIVSIFILVVVAMRTLLRRRDDATPTENFSPTATETPKPIMPLSSPQTVEKPMPAADHDRFEVRV